MRAVQLGARVRRRRSSVHDGRGRWPGVSSRYGCQNQGGADEVRGTHDAACLGEEAGKGERVKQVQADLAEYSCSSLVLSASRAQCDPSLEAGQGELDDAVQQVSVDAALTLVVVVLLEGTSRWSESVSEKRETESSRWGVGWRGVRERRQDVSESTSVAGMCVSAGGRGRRTSAPRKAQSRAAQLPSIIRTRSCCLERGALELYTSLRSLISHSQWRTQHTALRFVHL